MRTAANAVITSKIIDEVNALRDNSLDYYAAVRSSYYQNRNAAINNIDDSELTFTLISISLNNEAYFFINFYNIFIKHQAL